MDSKKVITKNSFVSIIIPVYNGELTLKNCLDSLENQTYDKERYEILVIDNNSTDRTNKIIEDWQVEGKATLRHLKEVKKGVVYARNLGAKEAKGDVLLFTDDDCVADSSWIQEHVNIFVQYQADAALGSVELSTPIPENTIFSDDFIKKRMAAIDHGKDVFQMEKEDLIGANMSIRRDVFINLKGFNPSRVYYLCEDTELSLRLEKFGAKRMYAPSAKIFHHFSIDRINERNFLKQSYVWGKANIIFEPVELSRIRYYIYCLKQTVLAYLNSLKNKVQGKKTEAFLSWSKMYGYWGRCVQLSRKGNIGS
jgi:glycosyltransferase involved in cell wall biosynthesis